VQVGAQPWLGGVRCEGAFQPALPLLEQPAGQPEPAQRPGQPRPGLAAADGQGVVQGGAEVVLLTHQNRQLAFPLRQPQERPGVPVPDPGGLTGLGQPAGAYHPFPGELRDRG
jgi:hypothetical protein